MLSHCYDKNTLTKATQGIKSLCELTAPERYNPSQQGKHGNRQGRQDGRHQEVDWSHCNHSQEAESQQEARPGYKTSRPVPNDSLTPNKAPSLKSSITYPHSNITSPGNQVFKYREACGGRFTFKPRPIIPTLGGKDKKDVVSLRQSQLDYETMSLKRGGAEKKRERKEKLTQHTYNKRELIFILAISTVTKNLY